MKIEFNISGANSTESILKFMGCEYAVRPDGKIFVPGNIDLSNKGLTELPDLSSVIVGGNFWCSFNQLKSLKGAPQEVKGDFICGFNDLTDLKGGPKIVGGAYVCEEAKLTTLDGAPESIGGEFDCDHNKLTSLKGAPKDVGDKFDCFGNDLRSLDYAPQKWRIFISDFGTFEPKEGLPVEVKKTVTSKAPRNSVNNG